MKHIIERIKERRGFTLSETMITLLIILLVFGVIVAGIPVAVNAMRKIVDAANSQMLMSTTMIKLRDELGKAESVTTSGTAIEYRTSDGISRRIDCVDATSGGGIYVAQFQGMSTTPTGSALLVSNPAASKNLHMIYNVASPAYSNGVLTLTDLTVKRGSETLFKIDKFKIRVLTYVE